MDRALYALEQIDYPSNRIRINILYNTPKAIEPLESELAALPQRFPHARVIKVPNSTSKADNLNYFFTLDTGSDIIAIYDCDHYPHPNSPRWAAERFVADKQVDIVQGRCIVFNSDDSFMTNMIAVEFDKIYAVSHPGRSTMWGFGLFCGSNGYWRTSLLRDLKMDDTMLTEDIDSALRAFSKGAKTVHDLNVTSYELAPTTFGAFWKQRLRWAQGWAQASMRHMKMVWNGVKDPLHEEHAKRSLPASVYCHYCSSASLRTIWLPSTRVSSRHSLSSSFRLPGTSCGGWSISNTLYHSGFSSSGSYSICTIKFVPR
jgi:cellulose synthase/poly-beta-1,6-N-acetylglucosamine synthase-like glycosyltransferase